MVETTTLPSSSSSTPTQVFPGRFAHLDGTSWRTFLRAWHASAVRSRIVSSCGDEAHVASRPTRRASICASLDEACLLSSPSSTTSRRGFRVASVRRGRKSNLLVGRWIRSDGWSASGSSLAPPLPSRLTRWVKYLHGGDREPSSVSSVRPSFRTEPFVQSIQNLEPLGNPTVRTPVLFPIRTRPEFDSKGIHVHRKGDERLLRSSNDRFRDVSRDVPRTCAQHVLRGDEAVPPRARIPGACATSVGAAKERPETRRDEADAAVDTCTVRWTCTSRTCDGQGAELMAKFGVHVPPGICVTKLSDVRAAAEKMGGDTGEVVVKSQILAGGRGRGTFADGFQGGVHIVKVGEAENIARKMLGNTLITKQSGAAGKPVNHLLIARKMQLVNEMYFALLLDRSMGGPVAIACSEGGTSIEDLAEKYPDKIVKVPIDINQGITDEETGRIVDALHPGSKVNRAEAQQQIAGLYEMFRSCDCTLVEVNPMGETADGKLICADAKINFDDNASFRQKEVFALRDTAQEDPREVRAAQSDLNYIGLDGEIGCMVNGAGLAMATMDIIKLHGGTPANFLDVGGSASEKQVVEAFKILTSDKQVKSILVNIFGGIMRCDVIASGIVNAAKEVGLNVPLVVRLEGTNVAQGRKILESSGVTIITANDLDDAAKKAVSTLSR